MKLTRLLLGLAVFTVWAPDIQARDPHGSKPQLYWAEVVNPAIEACTDGAHPIGTLDNLTWVLQDDAGSFTDESSDAAEATGNDVDPWPATPAVNDAFYIGVELDDDSADGVFGIFNAVRFDIGTQGATVMTVVWEYYNGSAWATLTFLRQDVADFDEATGVHWNVFDPPSDWKPTTVDSKVGYWIRGRVTAFTSHTTNALLDQMWTSVYETDKADTIVLRADSDETEDIWCAPDSDSTVAAIDDGFVLDSGTGVLTVEVEKSASNILCCGDGGAIANAVVMILKER